MVILVALATRRPSLLTTAAALAILATARPAGAQIVYHVPVNPAAGASVASSYSGPVHGTYALFVRAEPDREHLTYRQNEGAMPNCNRLFYRYDVDLSEPFRRATLEAMAGVVEKVAVVDRPLSASELAAGGYDGMITVRVNSLDTALEPNGQVLFANAYAHTDVSASVIVDGPEGRLFGDTEDARGESGGSIGFACANVKNVIGRSVQESLTKVLGRLSERLSNEPRLRAQTTAMAAPSPPPSQQGLDRPPAPSAGVLPEQVPAQCGFLRQRDGTLRLVPC